MGYFEVAAECIKTISLFRGSRNVPAIIRWSLADSRCRLSVANDTRAASLSDPRSILLAVRVASRAVSQGEFARM